MHGLKGRATLNVRQFLHHCPNIRVNRVPAAVGVDDLVTIRLCLRLGEIILPDPAVVL